MNAIECKVIYLTDISSRTVVPNRGEFFPVGNLGTAKGEYSDDEIIIILFYLNNYANYQ